MLALPAVRGGKQLNTLYPNFYLKKMQVADWHCLLFIAKLFSKNAFPTEMILILKCSFFFSSEAGIMKLFYFLAPISQIINIHSHLWTSGSWKAA